jgi:hypothetical protein
LAEGKQRTERPGKAAGRGTRITKYCCKKYAKKDRDEGRQRRGGGETTAEQTTANRSLGA